jgi:hypothetical protein
MPKVIWFSRVREKKVVRGGPQRPRRNAVHWRWKWPSATDSVLIAFAIFAVVTAALEFLPRAVGCNIKGNIAFDTGERIYHLPGQEFYWETSVNWLFGERYFCSEKAAHEAGWRKARV